jgi:hypothetical protein
MLWAGRRKAGSRVGKPAAPRASRRPRCRVDLGAAFGTRHRFRTEQGDAIEAGAPSAVGGKNDQRLPAEETVLVPVLGARKDAPIRVRQHPGRSTSDAYITPPEIFFASASPVEPGTRFARQGSRQRAFVAARKNRTAVSPTSTPQSSAVAEREGVS